jgi:hypothetical protein
MCTGARCLFRATPNHNRFVTKVGGWLMQFLNKEENKETASHIACCMAWALAHAQIIKTHIPGEKAGGTYMTSPNEHVL